MSASDNSRFKSEMFVPVRQDSHSFEERQRTIWDDMHERMEKRRKEWDEEVSRLRKDFFRLRPDDVTSGRRGSGGNEKAEMTNMFYTAPDGNKMFRVSFDVSQFQPNEINVTIEEQKLVVHARHEDKGADKTVSREFSRQVDLPHNVDQHSLRSTLSNDGILQVEAVIQTPSYSGFAGSPGPSSIRDGSVGLAHRLYSPTPPPTGRLTPTPTTSMPSTLTEHDGTQVFRIVVEIGAEFEPGDLAVKTVDKKLVVHARHEEKSPGRTSCREFNREFDLPDMVDPMSVSASMSSDGKLVIEAPIVNYSQGSYTARPGSNKQPTVTVSMGHPSQQQSQRVTTTKTTSQRY